MNKDILQQLTILEKYYKQKGGKDRFRAIAYGKAKVTIKSLDFKIAKKHLSQLRKLPYIGKKIIAKIQEYLETGKIGKAEEIKTLVEEKKTGKEEIIDRFKRIWGVGPVKAQFLYNMGIRSLNDIKPELLTRQQKIGLRYYNDLLKPIPRSYIDIFRYVLEGSIIYEFPKAKYKIMIAGSYRRGLLQSGDIDCLLSSKDFTLAEFINRIRVGGYSPKKKKLNLIQEVLSMKSSKFMGVAGCTAGAAGPRALRTRRIRLDIEFVPKNEWGAASLYFTGSRSYNILLREYAKKKGLILNQRGLFKGKKLISSKTEKDIFKALGLPYVPPERR